MVNSCGLARSRLFIGIFIVCSQEVAAKRERTARSKNFKYRKDFSCQRLQNCNNSDAAVDHRGFIKVDEVDGRSPVERAAATFLYPSCRGTSGQMMKVVKPR